MANLKKQKGMIVAYVLVFGSIALLLLSALLGYIMIQLRLAEQKTAWNEALNIAEAGIDYYRWCLNNGVDADCVGTIDYKDRGGVSAGKFLIEISQSNMCGQTINRKIISTGWTNKYSSVKRSIKVFYARESVAAYSGIISDGVWFGNDEALSGPFQANGGIRMDGPNGSLVSSAALLTESTTTAEWICDYSYGCTNLSNVTVPCSPTIHNECCPVANGCRISSGRCICPGVFTSTGNSNSSLFRFPVPPFDFNSITIDLGDIKNKSQNNGGIYLPKSNTVVANGKGYHLKFQSDGTVQVYIITSLSQTPRNNNCPVSPCYDKFIITAEVPNPTPVYTIPPACSAIYVEDSVWPEGAVKGKVTLASANLIPADNIDTNIILSNNISYAAGGGNGLLAIAENSVFIGPQSPDMFSLQGVYVAQKGAFYRNSYPGNIKTSFILYGSYISRGRPNETWVNSAGTVTSGYRNTAVYYDANLIYEPPAFMPYLNPDFKIVSWQEIN